MPDQIYVEDGALYTSAGVTAGIDLALKLIEDDHGRDLALTVARRLVVFLKRPGGQSQFSAHLAAQIVDEGKIRSLQHWILDHLPLDLSLEALASRVAMSVRNFTRVFQGETGTTPADFIEMARVDAARRLLEESEIALQRVASRCGFAARFDTECFSAKHWHCRPSDSGAVSTLSHCVRGLQQLKEVGRTARNALDHALISMCQTD